MAIHVNKTHHIGVPLSSANKTSTATQHELQQLKQQHEQQLKQQHEQQIKQQQEQTKQLQEARRDAELLREKV